MAKSKSTHPSDKPKAGITYPSAYGSHASMIDEEATKLLNDPNLVVCKDVGLSKTTVMEHPAFPDGMPDSLYITERKRLDDRSADPKRYPTSRLKILKSGKDKGDEAKK